MMTIKQKELAKRFKVSPAFVSLLKSGDRFTEDRELAKSVSAITGKKAIFYIPPKLRDDFLAIDNSLDNRYQWETMLVKK